MILLFLTVRMGRHQNDENEFERVRLIKTTKTNPIKTSKIFSQIRNPSFRRKHKITAIHHCVENSSRISYVIKTSKNEKIVKSLDVINTSKIFTDLINATKVIMSSFCRIRQMHQNVKKKSYMSSFRRNRFHNPLKRRKAVSHQHIEN